MATLVLHGVFRVNADPWIPGLGIAFLLLSVLFIIAPGIAFLIHSWRHRVDGVTPRLRYSATASAIAPALLGALVIAWEGGAQIFGWILVCLAVAVAVRAWTLRKTDATANEAVLGRGYPVAGLVFVMLFAASGRPHHHSPSRAYMTAMKSDLRNLVSAQEAFFADQARFTTDLVELGFKPSTGVSPPKVTVGQGWWHATNIHSQLSNVMCGIAVNTTNPVVDTVGHGRPACR